MRSLLFLMACGGALLACDDSAESMMAPEPEAAEPESPEPDSPEPEGVDPDPEPEPDYGPAPAPGDGVFWGLGTLLVQVSGDDAFAMGGTLVVTLITSDGERLPSQSAPMGQYPVEIDWRVQRWWPVDAAAIDGVTDAEVEVRDGDRVLRTQTVTVTELPVVETGCDLAGFANRCAEGSTCFAVDAESAGRCDPVSARIWGHAERLHVDLRADRGGNATLAQPTLWRADEAERIVLRAVDGPGWRAVGNLWRDDDDPATFALFIGPHMRHAAAPVEAPPSRAPGEACDVLRLADTCPDDHACSALGACTGVSPPRLDRAVKVSADGMLGVWFEGADADGDVERLLVRALDTGEEEAHWLQSVQAHSPSTQGGVAQGDGDALTGLWMARHDAVPAGPIEVMLIDAEGLRSAPLRVEDQAQPRSAEVGGLCDDAGVLVECPAGTGCDLRDGDRAFSCQPLTAECAAPERFEPFVGEVMLGSNAGPDATTNSCHRSRGNLGNEAGYVVTAERAGTHVFTADDAGYGVLGSLAVRRVCHLSSPRTSELACARDMSQGNGAASLQVEVDLDAGETVYVVVESHWVGGGPFQLTLSRP